MGSFDDVCSVVEHHREPLQGEKDEFWRKADPIKDAKGALVTGGMFQHQREWWALKNFIKLLVGGYGSGKTNIAVKRAIAVALQNAPCPVAMIAPSFPQARRTVIPTLQVYLSGKRQLFGRDFSWTFNKTFHEFRISYHGRRALIYIASGEIPDSLRGPNLAAAYIDEPFLQEESVFNQMIARVRHPDAVHKEIGLTGTPEQLNWGYDLAVGDLRSRHDVGIVTASSRQNTVLDQEYVKRLLGAFDGKAAEAYIEGKFVNLAKGQVYYAFDPVLHCQELDVPENAELGVGMDFNVNPMACCVFWRAAGHMHVFEEYEFPNADTEYVAQFLRERHPRMMDVYPDASGSARKTSAPGGRTDFTYLKEQNFTIRAPYTNPKRKDRYNAVNGKLKPASGSRPTLTISRKCTKLVKYLSLYSHDLMKKQEAMSHLLDAFSYPVSFLFPIDKDALSVHKLSGV